MIRGPVKLGHKEDVSILRQDWPEIVAQVLELAYCRSRCEQLLLGEEWMRQSRYLIVHGRVGSLDTFQ